MSESGKHYKDIIHFPGQIGDLGFIIGMPTGSESLGTHLIKAVSNDNGGANTSDEISVEIISGGGGGGCDAPVAAFIASPTDGEAPLTVNFTDQSTNGPVSWHWDFGDGNIYTPGHNGGWWSSTPTNNFLVSLGLNFSLSEIILNVNGINDGISVRFIKD